MHEERQPAAISDREDAATWVPVAVGLLGPLSFLAFLAGWVAFDLQTESVGRTVGEFAISTVVAVVFVCGGYYLRTSDLSPRRYRRVAAWAGGGLVGFLAVNLVIMAVTPAATLEGNLGWARGTAVFGALGGLVIGLVEARSIERAERAERAAVRAEYADRQRRWFDYLNALLRHEVLNKANIIDGYAGLSQEETDDPEMRDRLAIIQRNAEQMASVIEDVRVLIQSAEEPDLRPVDVSAVLRDVLDDAQAIDADVVVESSIPDGVTVFADDLLDRVFANLVRNAIEHNEGGTARVSVSLVRSDDDVVVTVTDDGPGIPERERATLFQRGENTGRNHGLGLYLARRLVERYDGSIRLAETGPAGSTFSVTLQHAPDVSRDAERAAEPAAA